MEISHICSRVIVLLVCSWIALRSTAGSTLAQSTSNQPTNESSTGVTPTNIPCRPVWPWENHLACKLANCSNGMAVIDNVAHARCPYNYRYESFQYNMTKAGCPGAQAPGMPLELQARPPTYSIVSGFEIEVTWKDPVEARNLVGYRIMLEVPDGEKDTFDLLKEQTAVSANIGVNRNRIVFSNLAPSTVANKTVRLMPDQFLRCFIQAVDPTHHTISVTSLPVEDGTDRLGLKERTASQDFKVGACPEYTCKKHESFDGAHSTLSCPVRAYDAQYYQEGPMCYCYVQMVKFNKTMVMNETSATIHWTYTDLAIADVINRSNFRVDIYFGYGNSASMCTPPETEIGKKIEFRVPTTSLTFDVVLNRTHGPCAQLYLEFDDECQKPRTAEVISVWLADDADSSVSPSHTTISPMVVEPTKPPGVDADTPNWTVVAAVTASGLAVVLILILVLLIWQVGSRRYGNKGRRWTLFWHGKSLRYAKGLNGLADATRASSEKSPTPPDSAHGTRTRLTSLGDGPRVYISYSRFTEPDRWRAAQLYAALVEHTNLQPVLDVYHQNEIADNCPAWIETQVAECDCVLVLLSEKHMLNLNLNDDMRNAMLLADDDGSLQFAIAEASVLCSEDYSGRTHFLVPVFIGPPGRSIQDLVPTILVGKTIHRLPRDFDGTSRPFQRLAQRLIQMQMRSTDV